jgi:hypothetical protein
MCEFAKDAVLGDWVGEDFGDGPVSGSGGDKEDERADLTGGEDALGLAGIAVVISKAASKTISMAYICFAWRSRYTWTAVLLRFMTASKMPLITGCRLS